jgi:DNA-binding winged helix-turn-helix (wHTH) protein
MVTAIGRAPVDQRASITFSSFSLDLRAGRLTRGGETVPLRPKTWAVLQYLVERPGALVTKDALLEALWPDVSVSEDTLNKSIGELRVALGDEVKNPRFIETVHRRGFRFVADARREETVDIAVPAESSAIDANTGIGTNTSSGASCLSNRKWRSWP